MTSGSWYGPEHWFGLHYDLHAHKDDTDLGARCDPDLLEAQFRKVGVTWVQTDSKGVPGLTSWPSQTPGAAVAPGIKGDLQGCWREATRRLGLPLHAHYLSLWDEAAWEAHPDWRLVLAPERSAGDAMAPKLLCPLSDYAEQLMIPQLIELVERYGIDGFWVDAEDWAYTYCYCDRHRAAWRAETGGEPPTDVHDAAWRDWANFQRRTLADFTNRWVAGVKAGHPQVRCTADFAHTLHDPGEPLTTLDWLSGDTWQDLNEQRQEARFLATRGRPWDLMLWCFDVPKGRGEEPANANVRTVAEIARQGLAVITQGGNLQIYTNPSPLRDGRLVPWQIERLAEVRRLLAPRQAAIVGGEPLPQVAILHSEHHFRALPVHSPWKADVLPVRGALHCCLEQSLSAELYDEWALTPVVQRYPLVVIPEQDGLSDAMVATLKTYVREGGRLLLTGAGLFERFGAEFLGAETAEVRSEAPLFLPLASAAVSIWSKQWRLLQPTSARPLLPLGTLPLLDEGVLPNPGAIVNRVGEGYVAYLPGDVMRVYAFDKRPELRAALATVIEGLAPELAVRVTAPPEVDVVLRRKGGQTQVHLLNRDDAPSGPVRVRVARRERPAQVALQFEEAPFSYDWHSGALTAEIGSIALHAMLLIE